MKILHRLPNQIMIFRFLAILPGPIIYINLVSFQMRINFEWQFIIALGLAWVDNELALILPFLILIFGFEERDPNNFITEDEYTLQRLVS